jgi:hypothetical protein
MVAHDRACIAMSKRAPEILPGAALKCFMMAMDD